MWDKKNSRQGNQAKKPKPNLRILEYLQVILLFLAPPITKMELQQWSYSQKFWLLSYSIHLSLEIDVHYSSKVKKNILFYFVFTLMENIYFFFLLLPHFYPLLLSPLSRSSHSSFLPVASFNSSTRRRTKPLASADNAD